VDELAAPDSATRELGQLTAHGVIVGTPDYMSPEQVKGLPVDRRSDQFSFGAIVTEMLTGRHPFRQRSTMETFSAVLREPPAFGSDVPPRLLPALQRLLAKDAADRYPSMADARADLARLAAAPEPVGVVERGPRQQQRPLWKRPAFAIGLVAVIGLALV